jgi:2'-5' RNA ligase
MRCFFCLELTPVIKSQLDEVVRRLKHTPANLRWVRSDLMHVTLKFLGDIDVDFVPDLQTLTKEIAQHHASFDLTIDCLGAFPNPDRAKVIWAGCSQPRSTLLNLHAELDKRLSSYDFKRERNFKPHITLGRVRDSNPNALKTLSAQLQAAHINPMRIHINQITLMENMLGRGGPDYAALFKVKL